MFERFTEAARQVVVLAQDEARNLKHNYIGTEHLLLGLLREEKGLAAQVLASLEIKIADARSQVGEIIGQGDELTTGQIPFTPRAKKVLELALREALGIGHNYIGTEHLLLGLARENEGVANRILADSGADARTIAERTLQILGRSAEESAAYAAGFVTGGPKSSEPRNPLWPMAALRPARSSVTELPVFRSKELLVLGWLLFGGAAGIGLVVGWLIWG